MATITEYELVQLVNPMNDLVARAFAARGNHASRSGQFYLMMTKYLHVAQTLAVLEKLQF